jgi:hypothetical protein
MSATCEAQWLNELEAPSPAFFQVFAQRVAPGEGAQGAGARDAAQEAVRILTPGVDWAAYLPHIPHGLLGLQGVFRLEPLLDRPSFLRVLATQIHAFAFEARSPGGRGLEAVSQGSGHWGNLQMAVTTHRPTLAWGEAMGVERPEPADFHRLEAWAEKDMANVGHKSVTARALGDLHQALGRPQGAGRALLALAAWLCASEPHDTFWHDRAARRLEGAPPVPFQGPSGRQDLYREGAREICDSGLVELLDRFSARVRSGLGSGDLLAMLVRAAAEKQLDARRDLEGKTAWNFVFLAGLAKATGEGGRRAPENWVQAAALVNLFPTGEEEERPRARAPRTAPGDPAQGLLDALLDAEPQEAMHLAGELGRSGGAGAVLEVLTQAASSNDPAFNHSHQVLAVAAGADLLPFLDPGTRDLLLAALAKFLANSQGSSDLGTLASRSLKAVLM